MPQDVELDPQLDILADRGKKNGATVEFLDQNQLKEIIPEAEVLPGVRCES